MQNKIKNKKQGKIRINPKKPQFPKKSPNNQIAKAF